MLLQFILPSLAALAISVQSAVVPRQEADLDVQLRVIDNTLVEAVVTNKADHEIVFLTPNSFLDPAPVQKVSVQHGSQ
jgi:hypothetical protein